jgi:hypothetical protein
MIPHHDFLVTAAADRVRELRAAAERDRDARLARRREPKPTHDGRPVHAPTGCRAQSAA